MAGVAGGKLRILYIMRMLQEETDDQRGLSMADIISRLADYGMSADRKTVYADLDLLREFGLEIGTAQRNPVEYYLARRDFSIDELMLMVDAVQSCRFVTQSQAEKICRNLKLLATVGQQKKLERRIHVEGRARGRNDAVLANVDIIHDALRQKRRITFTYWKMGMDGKPHAQHQGEVYDVTPMRVTFAETYYYLTAWSEKHGAVREYRIDRMRDVALSQEKARRGKEISEYEYQVRDSQFFGRFDCQLVTAQLVCNESGVNIVADRFGKDARFVPQEDGTCIAAVQVRVSPQFFGWIASMNGTVKIAGPTKLAEEYRAFLQSLL